MRERRARHCGSQRLDHQGFSLSICVKKHNPREPRNLLGQLGRQLLNRAPDTVRTGFDKAQHFVRRAVVAAQRIAACEKQGPHQSWFDSRTTDPSACAPEFLAIRPMMPPSGANHSTIRGICPSA